MGTVIASHNVFRRHGPCHCVGSCLPRPRVMAENEREKKTKKAYIIFVMKRDDVHGAICCCL